MRTINELLGSSNRFQSIQIQTRQHNLQNHHTLVTEISEASDFPTSAMPAPICKYLADVFEVK